MSKVEEAQASENVEKRDEPRPERTITVKAVTAGLVGIVLIGLYSNANDRVLKLPPLVGNHMPIGAFTLILVLATVWNPLVGRFVRRLRFGTRELALAFGMMLVTSWLPGSSFWRYFHCSIVMPWTSVSTHPDWQTQKTLSYLPDRLFPLAHDQGTDPARYEEGSDAQIRAKKEYERVYGSFVRGIPEGDQKLPVTAAPYREWAPIMKYWAPLVLFMTAALGALVWVVHRQWSHHEQLSYPIASVQTALIERTGNRTTSDIFYSKLFWGGFTPVFLIHLCNYLNAWYPANVPKIPLGWSAWSEWRDLFPVLGNSGYWQIGSGQFRFIIIGIAYFIASEVSLSMGLTSLAMIFVSAQYFIFTGQTVSGDDNSCTMAGAYLMYFLILAYIGRHYYMGIFARAIGLRRREKDNRESVWAARVFLVGFLGFVWALASLIGVEWVIALVYAAVLVGYFLVFSRITVESGIPFNQAFDTGVMITNTLGLPALGPAALTMVLYLGIILNPDARECMTPYVANTLKMAERVGVSIPRLLIVGAAATVVAFSLGFFAQTYSLYNNGAHNDDYAVQVPSWTFDRASTNLANLRDAGQFEASSSARGLAKLALVKNNFGHARHLRWMAFGVVGVLLCSLLRFRFTKWPIHPVLFLMWGTWTATITWFSFLVGWLIKALIVRFGGGRTYERLKPLFIGLIMGEIVAVAMTLAVGAIYYYSTGLLPKSTGILPG
jgi:hypothetical protein